LADCGVFEEMKLCPICWQKAGRALDVSDCLCSPTTSVLQNSAFHKWNSTRLVPLPEKRQDAPKREERVFKAPRLQFGIKPVKDKSK